MNYYLSVVPYLGAVNAGMANETVIVPPTDNNPSKFCLTLSGCNSTLVGKWTTYFQTVQAIQAGTHKLKKEKKRKEKKRKEKKRKEKKRKEKKRKGINTTQGKSQ
jgi:hypothetical protein